MAAYSASKHAVEGYSESVDHEVRDHGIRVLLVEPAVTKTNFDNARFHLEPEKTSSVYAAQRRNADNALAEAVKVGDEPDVVANAIVAAATDRKPKLARRAVSQPPARSTSRSASSTSWPANACTANTPTRSRIP
jgi:short-subunit dehydrogenase